MPGISHLELLGFKREYLGKASKTLIAFFLFFKKKVVLSVTPCTKRYDQRKLSRLYLYSV